MYSFDELKFKASEVALSMNHGYATVDHLFVVLLELDSIRTVLKHLSIDPLDADKRIREFLMNSTILKPLKSNPEQVIASTMLVRVFNDMKKEAIVEQLKKNDHTIEPYFLLLQCLLFRGTAVHEYLNENNLDPIELCAELQQYVQEEHNAFVSTESLYADEVPQHTKNAKSRNKVDITEFTDDLTELARENKLGKLIGRTNELMDLTQILSRKKKKNPILVGEAGVGKTEIVYGLANAIVAGNVPDNLKDATILSLNVGALLAGAKYRGDFEKKVQEVLDHIETKENVILFIDEIHTMMGAGSGSSEGIDLSNMLKPALSDGSIRLIGATTNTEYSTKICKDAAIERRLMKIDVKEPSKDEVLEIVFGIRELYETHHNVKYPDATIHAIVDMSDLYLHNKKFPDKAIDLLDASGARNRIKTQPSKEITIEDVAFEVSRISNIPEEIVLSTDSTKMRNLKSSLEARVFGQDEAINEIVNSVMIAHAGLRERESIQSAFMFVGSSGTGKTELSKALADSLGVKLVRFDMSEFKESHTVSKLLGAPAGYVGYDAGNGLLLDKIDENPHCVLLLDEIEKAHPDVLLPLLQVMDEGHLTGSRGKTVYFNNVTLIMTTNLGTRNSSVRSLTPNNSGDDGISTAIKEFLAPEFLNRIDAIVRFVDLSDKVIESIIDKNLSQLNSVLKAKNINVVLDKNARAWLLKNGVQKGMGARPMKRCFTKNIKEVIAPMMLYGELMEGNKEVTFGTKDDKLVIKKMK